MTPHHGRPLSATVTMAGRQVMRSMWWWTLQTRAASGVAGFAPYTQALCIFAGVCWRLHCAALAAANLHRSLLCSPPLTAAVFGSHLQLAAGHTVFHPPVRWWQRRGRHRRAQGKPHRSINMHHVSGCTPSGIECLPLCYTAMPCAEDAGPVLELHHTPDHSLWGECGSQTPKDRLAGLLTHENCK